MNDPTQEQKPTEPSALSFGEKIRQAREKRQLSIDDLVGETRIHPQHLADLEQGKTSGISASGYVIGYLKTLAKILDLDAESLISDYKSSINQSGHQIIDPEHELLPVQRKKNSLGWGTVLATTIIVVAGLGAVGYYWWENINDETSETQQREELEEDTSNQDEVEQSNHQSTEELNSAYSSGRTAGYSGRESGTASDVDENMLDVGNYDNARVEDSANLNGSDPSGVQTNMTWVDLMNMTQDSSSYTTNGVGTEPREEAEHDEADSAIELEESEQTDDAVEDEPPLVFEFSDISYVEVTDADDEQLVAETKQAGSTLELDGKAPFVVKLGFAPGVTVFYKGDKVDLKGYTRRNIAEFELPR